VLDGVSRLSDSPWDITASFEDSKLWQTTHLKPPVTAILSTIVANWQAPGILHKKPISECSPNEIVDELVAQISQHQGIKIERSNVYTFHIDNSIQFSADNSKIIANTMKHYCVQVDIPENEPKATTPINNLFLAGDYVATGMHNGTMESANMSGKIAANEIMKVTKHQNDLCIILKNPFSE
jgi:uncharacterized protein with NAD-binding domain and iron-sulfur cluster